MSEGAYDLQLTKMQQEPPAASPADEPPHQVGRVPAGLFPYPYNSALEKKECKKADDEAKRLAELEQFKPEQDLERVINGNRIRYLTMALEHRALDNLRYGLSLSKNRRYEEAKSAFRIGLCYARRFPDLRAKLQAALDEAASDQAEAEKKLAGH